MRHRRAQHVSQDVRVNQCNQHTLVKADAQNFSGALLVLHIQQYGHFRSCGSVLEGVRYSGILSIRLVD